MLSAGMLTSAGTLAVIVTKSAFPAFRVSDESGGADQDTTRAERPRRAKRGTVRAGRRTCQHATAKKREQQSRGGGGQHSASKTGLCRPVKKLPYRRLRRPRN